eukprot:scaffold116582_cov37-Phaeocystis_antarctica.AAC.2
MVLGMLWPMRGSKSPNLGLSAHVGASAQVERAARCCRCFDSDTQTWCGSVTVIAPVAPKGVTAL